MMHIPIGLAWFGAQSPITKKKAIVLLLCGKRSVEHLSSSLREPIWGSARVLWALGGFRKFLEVG